MPDVPSAKRISILQFGKCMGAAPLRAQTIAPLQPYWKGGGNSGEAAEVAS